LVSAAIQLVGRGFEIGGKRGQLFRDLRRACGSMVFRQLTVHCRSLPVLSRVEDDGFG
jgi:hypothetical protein